MFLFRLWNILFLNCPAVCLRESAWIPGKQFAGFVVVFQLPLIPGSSYPGKFATIRLMICTTMSYIHISNENRYVIYLREIVHSILIGNVRRSSQQIKRRSVYLFQVFFAKSRHTGRPAGWVGKNTAIANYHCTNSWIAAHF